MSVLKSPILLLSSSSWRSSVTGGLLIGISALFWIESSSWGWYLTAEFQEYLILTERSFGWISKILCCFFNNSLHIFPKWYLFIEDDKNQSNDVVLFSLIVMFDTQYLIFKGNLEYWICVALKSSRLRLHSTNPAKTLLMEWTC